MKEIPLTQGYFAKVDDEDYETLSRHKWCAAVGKRLDGSALVYAMRRIKKNGKWTTQRMHRLILGETDSIIDHIDGDGLNNVRHNMRLCDRQGNRRNSRPQVGYTSKYKGVHWAANAGKWRSRIQFNGGGKSIGMFNSEDDAARAYDDAARKYFGEFARLNFPGGSGEKTLMGRL